MSDRQTVYLIDHDKDARSETESLLRSVEIPVETFDSGLDFLDRAGGIGPGCLVLDTRLPGLGGLELQERVSKWEIAPPIIITTAHGDIPMAVQAMRTGAIDFIEKPCRPQILLDRVYAAFERDTANRRAHANLTGFRTRAELLTAREREVMLLVVTGLPNKVVAQRLGVTRKAVEAYRARVMRKMQATSLAELVRINVALEQAVGLGALNRRPVGPTLLRPPGDLPAETSLPRSSLPARNGEAVSYRAADAISA